MKILSDKALRLVSSIYVFSLLVTNHVFSQVNVTYDTNSTLLRLSAAKLEQVMKDVKDHDVQHPAVACIFVLSARTKTSNKDFLKLVERNIKGLQKEGFRIHRVSKNKIFVIAKDETGCAYGMQDLTEQLRERPHLSVIKEKTVNPAFEFRAIKFNLPWSPYRPGPQAVSPSARPWMALEILRSTAASLRTSQAYRPAPTL